MINICQGLMLKFISLMTSLSLKIWVLLMGIYIVYNLELGFALVSFANDHNLLYWKMAQFLRLVIQ